MEKNLPVPYKSQWDDDARGTANDCGPSSISMILNYYGEQTTTDQIYKATGAGLGLITIAQMQKAITSHGYDSQFKQNVSIEELKGLLDKNIPVIALVHYGSLNSVQDKTYKSGHFFVVVGYRSDGYYVNDPNFKGEFRAHGDHHFFTKDEFEKAWSDCYLDKNPNNSILIIVKRPVATPTLPITPQTRNVTIVVDQGSNVRTAPSTKERNILRVLTKGSVVAVEGYLAGDTVNNNNVWWKIKDEASYIWSGTTNFIPVLNTQSPTPPQESQTPIPEKEQTTENIEQLKLQIEGLKQEINRVKLENRDFKNANDNLILENGKLTKDLAQYGDLNFETVRNANESLSEQNKILLQKNSDLRKDRDEAYARAFIGWDLIEVHNTVSVLSTINKIFSLIGVAKKEGLVIGWKKGAKLYSTKTEVPAINPQKATLEDLNVGN